MPKLNKQFLNSLKPVERGILKDNSLTGIERPADERRTALLSIEDYRALGDALAEAEREGDGRIGLGASRLLALTRCRRGDVPGEAFARGHGLEGVSPAAAVP